MTEHLSVRVVKDWGWWFRIGEEFEVSKYPYRATVGATTDKCQCALCEADRFGFVLHEMYVVEVGAHRGDILPIPACEVR